MQKTPTLQKLEEIARKHRHVNASALACWDTLQVGAYAEYRTIAALRCIAHAVGILHQDYITAFSIAKIAGPCRLVGFGEAFKLVEFIEFDA